MVPALQDFQHSRYPADIQSSTRGECWPRSFERMWMAATGGHTACVHVRVCTYVSMHRDISVSLCLCVGVYIWVYLCVYICAYLPGTYVCVWVCICMSVALCVSLCVFVSLCMYPVCVSVCPCMYLFVCTCMSASLYIWVLCKCVCLSVRHINKGKISEWDSAMVLRWSWGRQRWQWGWPRQ
jgi:hypothetical protein